MSTIAEHRRTLGLTQAEFALKLGIKQPYLSQIEAGERRPGLRVALAIEKETSGAIPVTYWENSSPLREV